MLYPKKNIDPKKYYYVLTREIDPEGRLIIGGYTEWVGFADADCRVELRSLSEANPDYFADFWIKQKLPFCVVNTPKEYIRWYFTGGNALVAIEIKKEFLPNVITSSPCVKIGNLGFTHVRMLPKDFSKRAPTPKTRMRVLKRDNLRCRICGCQPDNNTDVELNIHHIRPFGEGGITYDANLITLCNTCHRGLEPHYDLSLYNLIENTTGKDIKTQFRKKYLEGVKRYQKYIKNFYKK
jgi:hypothetical protein